MIRALAPDTKANWPRHLQTLTFMYNSTVHETTGYAPFFLMFGRIPRLPVDVLFRNVLNDPAVASYDKYVVSLVKDLKDAMLIAQEHATKEQHRHAELYNRRAKGPAIDIGDRVLVANKKERGKRKVADRWESTVYTVVDRNTETHTYKIRDTATGKERVIHRNMLMLVNFLPMDDTSMLTDPGSSSPSAQLSMSGNVSASIDDPDSLPDAIEGDHDSGSESQQVQRENGHEPVDSEGRTVEWVARIIIS